MSETLHKNFFCIECDTCAVCLEPFSASNINISYTNCGHKFHSSCLLSSKSNKCPNCRNIILENLSDKKNLSTFQHIIKISSIITLGILSVVVIVPVLVTVTVFSLPVLLCKKLFKNNKTHVQV